MSFALTFSVPRQENPHDRLPRIRQAREGAPPRGGDCQGRILGIYSFRPRGGRYPGGDAMNEWRDISTAPDEGTIIVFGGIHTEPEAVLADGNWWRHQKRVNPKSFVTPTHWMPLPEPPK